MKKIKPRIPEGGAIEDGNEMSMEQYSETMIKKTGLSMLIFYPCQLHQSKIFIFRLLLY